MARKPRIEYDGAFYHVITRGNQRQKIFKEPVDYQQFLQVLATYKSRYSFHLYEKYGLYKVPTTAGWTRAHAVR